MPPTRNIPSLVRSRRLSRQAPKCYNEDVLEGLSIEGYDSDVTLRYPSESASASTSTSTSKSPSPSPQLSTDPSTYPVHSAQLQLSCGSSHSRRRSENHIPRPPNAFICFRSAYWLARKDNPIETDHRQVSRSAGKEWKLLTPAQREPWEKMARELKKQHAEKYPNYKYTPTTQKRVVGKKKKSKEATKAEVKRCEELANRLIHGQRLEDIKEEEMDEGGESVDEVMSASVPVPGAQSPPPSPMVKMEEVPDRLNNTSPEPAPFNDVAHSSLSSDPSGLSDVDSTPKPTFAMSEEVDNSPSRSHFDPRSEGVLEFVPTDEIPSIESEMSTLKIHTGCLEGSPSPPPFLRVDPQFGSKPEIWRVDSVLSTTPGFHANANSSVGLGSGFGSAGRDPQNHVTSLSMTASGSNIDEDSSMNTASLTASGSSLDLDEDGEPSLFEGYTISGAYKVRYNSEPPISPRSIPITGSAGENMWDYVLIPED